MDRQAEQVTVALHIGAHKTATTHLQRSLLAAQDDLRDIGVQFHGPRSFRWGQPSLLQRFAIADKPSGPVKAIDPQAFDTLRDGAGRLILSEENFPGTFMNDKGRLRRPLYPDGPRRIAELVGRMPVDGADVFLAIRQPTRLLNSAFSQRLHAKRDVTLEKFLKRNAIELVDWVRLIDRLRRTPGVKSLTVWRYEDYAALFPQIIAGLAGPDAVARVKPLAETMHGGLSELAVTLLLADETISVEDAMTSCPVDDTNPRFDAFDADAHALGDEFYAAQLSQIDAMRDVTRLRP